MPNKPKEKWKTYGNVFDEFTINALKKLIGQGHFEGIESPISIGKEANIFTGKTANGYVAIKIYRLEACDFNRMFDYLKYDVRYPKVRKGKRNIVFTWTQREYRNLMNARDAGVNVPTPITRLQNILVLELIGNSEIGQAEMKLKQKIPADPKDFMNQVVDSMKKLFKAGLVHGDLSEYNILNHEETPVIIDMSQSSSTKSSNAPELLERDIKNVVRYFTKLGVKTDYETIKKKILSK